MRAHIVAVALAVGIRWAPGWPPWVLAVVVPVGAFALRRPRTGLVVAAAAAFVVGGVVQARAWASLDRPAAGRVDGWVTLLDDPAEIGPVSVAATARVDGRKVIVMAHGGVAGRVDDVAAGERLWVRGTLVPVSVDDHRALGRRVVGRLAVDEVLAVAPGPPVASAANAVRDLLDAGAEALDRGDRALFLGMVVGDDRGQRPVDADAFAAAGLGHLLVVSGQNVAFVLAVAAPLATRLRPAGRAVVLLAVIGGFAVVTRFEPSVLRASAMAAVSVGAAALGTPVDGRVALSAAVAGLLGWDPLLAGRVAFQLSVAATAGIVWGSGPIARVLGGPRWLATAAATTLSAQLAVTPLLLARFGSVPLASLPANVLVEPVNAAVMVWGSTAGLVAGVVGGRAAAVLHLPTRVGLAWITGVAGWAALAPAAELSRVAWGLVVVGLGGAARGWWRRCSLAVLGALVVVAAMRSVPGPPVGCRELEQGVRACGDGVETVVVLDAPGRPDRVLAALRRGGVRRVALVIARDGDRADADAVLALRDRFGTVAIAAPPGHRVPGGRVVRAGRSVVAAGATVTIVADTPRLEISVTATGASR